MTWSPSAALEWLFGREGSVATEDELQVVMAATAAAVSGVFVVGPIVSTLAGPFGVSEAAAGQLVTAFTAPSVVLVPVFGVLADRVGRRPLLVLGLLALGLGGGAIAVSPSFEVTLALRVLQGVGYAAINPLGVAIIGDAYAGSRESTAQGLRVVSIQTAGLVVPPVAGGLVLAGWQLPFLLYLVAVPMAAWAWLSLPDSRRERSTSLRGYAANLRSSLSRPALGAVVLSFAARFSMTFSFLAYVSVLLAGIGASSVEAGATLGLAGFVSILASTQAGRVTEAVDPALALLASFGGLAVGLVVMGVAGSLAVVLLAVVVYAVAVGVSGPLQKSLVTQLSPPDVRAGTVSSAVTFQSVGAAGGPFLMGVALEYVDPGVAFVGFGLGLGAAGAALTVVALRSARREAARSG